MTLEFISLVILEHSTHLTSEPQFHLCNGDITVPPRKLLGKLNELNINKIFKFSTQDTANAL